MYVCAWLRPWTAVIFLSKADFLSRCQWILVLTITQWLKFTICLFENKIKKVLKQVTVTFSSFDLHSSVEISSFLLDVNKCIYFGTRISKVVSQLFSTSTSCTNRKVNAIFHRRTLPLTIHGLVVQIHLSATKKFLFISLSRQPPVYQLSLLIK
jgi:hypothetical protein